ncbi:hypothetical protein C7B62_09860 [Pleurocapsa sp. CCALA 161]|nr:hypothetical protein C7B62_09860 [Pleurocapsa sp. CCALA 161]
MKNKEFYKLLKKSQSNSGFTLTELLVGLVMSIFVIGALGFGLMQVLGTSQSEGSKTTARNETGRALDFISDELRRAQAIEVDMSSSYLDTTNDTLTTLINEEVAPDFVLPTGGTVSLALQIPGVSQRVIYFVAPPATGSPWKGPLVIYRWGPELTANGSYVTDPTKAGRVNNPFGWTKEALIDNIDDTDQDLDCDGDGIIDSTYQGFFACVVDDDGDDISENADSNNDGFVLAVATDVDGDGIKETADTASADVNGDGTTDSKDLDMNEDGVTNFEDNADSDGKSITAQLFFTGETITVSGTSSYSADTQTVARARIAPENNSEELTSYSWSIEGLGGEYNCKSGTPWDMQTDFSNSIDPNDKTTWIQTRDNNKQPQPIEIDSTQPLRITSTPINGAADCNSSSAPVEHIIDFGKPKTFNGDCEPDPDVAGSSCSSLQENNSLVKGDSDEAVQFFKKGYEIPRYGGYDANGNGEFNTGDQPSLGKFLYDKGLAILKDPTQEYTTAILNDSDTEFIIPTAEQLASRINLPTGKVIKVLGKDQRIIGFEIGDHDNTEKPGFDLQDNIFIVTSGVFEKKFKPTCFSDSGCS